MTAGTYTLLFKLNGNLKLEVGKLGVVSFKKGYYAYTGSALGRAGFRRIARHLEIASGIRKVRKWHIDYLLPFSEILGVFKLEDSRKMECEVAGEIGKRFKAIRDFGATDCKCEAHLHYSSGRRALERFVAGRYLNITSG